MIPESDKRWAVIGKIRPFISYFGFWQTNIFFAPDVPRINVDVRAEIKCKDGRTIPYAFPHLEELPLIERIVKTPYRKYTFYYLTDEAYKACRADCAKYLARKFATAECTPDIITLECYSADVPPPEIGLHSTIRPPHLKRTKLIEYHVTPADLE